MTLALPTELQLPLAVGAAALAGIINAIAGGGTLLTFPALLGLGIPPVTANATSAVALWPGALGSMWGYRGELAGARGWLLRFTVPSLLGGLTGALLLIFTSPERFSRLVPLLVLGATLLFLLQGPVMRAVARRRAAEGADHAPSTVAFFVAQFAVGIYGGYFGAGVGILMLATLGFMGFTNIHRMNGLKNWGGLCMNAVAAVAFTVSGLVNWPVALAMAVGGLLGGYAGSRLAQRVGQAPVRRAIVAIGLGTTVWLLVRPL